MNKKQPELLAPAGTPEAAWAALSYGTDAIYAGLPRFSARAEAGNFTVESLGEMIGYAHHLGRKVYVTFNTLVQERELGEALEMLGAINDAHERLEAGKRFDMPGFRPNEHYIREMQQFGFLPKDLGPDDPVDPRACVVGRIERAQRTQTV